MKIVLLLSCAAGAVLLLALSGRPRAVPGAPLPPSAALLETMSSHGIEVGTAPRLQPAAYTVANTPEAP